MVKIDFIVFFLLFFSFHGSAQVITVPDSMIFSGVVIHRETNEVLPDVHCRYGATRGTVSDAEGCFRLKVHRGDSIVFTSVGFQPFTVIVPDTLYEREYLLGVFMTPDTLLLPEVLILRRWRDSWYQHWNHLQNSMAGILRQAYAPVKEMDAEQNHRRVIDEYARKVEMKGHVDVGFGVGTQSLDAFRLWRMRKKLKEKKNGVSPDEIDLLKKVYNLEKTKKKDN